MPGFQAPVGTRDVLPPESTRWERLIALFARRAERSGYGLVVSPMFEDIGVFERVGEATDVVRKEMYDFEDKGGRRMALRPEGTASLVRAWVQHRPTLPFKAWYAAPSFRYERPQAGRYRQHHQLGVEALGTDDADLDVEVIALAWGLYGDVGLGAVRLLLNSLGDATCRPAYLDALRAYLTEHRAELCDEHKARLEENPLRVLDCKRESCMRVTEGAPRMVDHLCDECAAHFSRVREGLGELDIPFELAPRLVRGLDYYTRTTFEFQAPALESAQNGIGGGGRYDALTEQLGGPPTPGIGFGIGIERVLLACDAEGVFAAPPAAVAVFVVDVTGSVALRLVEELREAGVGAERAFDRRSMKAQFKLADRSGARLAVVVGPDELERGIAKLQSLTGDDKEEEDVKLEELVERVRARLGPA
ncbi:MAG: histidine--tRNA ligase [Acidimicrobiia bacterium]|nr:histidine--tRNA ligase [Acidimicrobiia bacterium]